MNNYNPDCLGNYDFDKIAYYARKRHIEGCTTMELLQQATCTREKEEIVLVASLDIDDDVVEELKLTCRHADKCKVADCRENLKQLIEKEMLK